MSWGAVAAIGGAVIGAGASMYSSKKAADSQEEAAQDAANAREKAAEQGGRASAEAIAQARGDINSGYGKAYKDLTGGMEKSLEEIPDTDIGTKASLYQAALSGVSGPEAQQQAFDEYIESPGQKYFREQQEQALLRNQAALGGLGGGNVRTALQEQAFGIAAQQQQQHFQNVGEVADRGFREDAARSGIYERLGFGQSNLESNKATALANIAMAQGASQSAMYQGIGNAQATGIQGAGDARTAGILGTGQAIQSGIQGVAYGLGAYQQQPTQQAPIQYQTPGQFYGVPQSGYYNRPTIYT